MRFVTTFCLLLLGYFCATLGLHVVKAVQCSCWPGILTPWYEPFWVYFGLGLLAMPLSYRR
jgi:hypothetical protein